MSLQGRVALVTGGGRGIGRAIAVGLARDGADVAINYRQDEGAAMECVREIETLGRRARAYRAAVEHFADDASLVESATRDLGAIDIFVSNAGVKWHGANVADTEPKQVEEILRVNAIGPHYLCKLVLPGMRTKPRGDIVVLSSAATEYMNGQFAPYNMSKAAVEALAFTLAKEELRHGIHVNVIAPGLVETPMGREWAESEGIADMRQMDEKMPFGHVCQPEEVAAVARFLVSESGSYVTGQRIYVHGGATVAPKEN